MSQKAIVLEVNNKYCTVVTSGGDFRKVRMSGDFRAGQEILLPGSRPGLYRYALAAACLAFIIVTAGLWKFWTLPAVAAYVCLDINPSVEMALDSDRIVRGVNPLNDDGKNLVDGLDLKGKDVGEAVEDIVAAALDKKYILPGEENVVMSSVIPAGEADDPVIEAIVRESIDGSLQRKNIQAEVAVLDATPEVREEAGKAGMSTGRYMLYLNARERGADVSPGDFKNKSIRLIEKEQRISVSEIEKSPPGHWKGKTLHQQDQSQGTAKDRGEYGESKKPGGRPGGSAENNGGWARPVSGNNKGGPPDRDRDLDKGEDNSPGGHSEREKGEDGQDSRDSGGGGHQEGNSGTEQDKGKDMSGGNNTGHADKETGGNRGGSDNGQGSSGSAVSGGNGGSGEEGSSDKGENGKDNIKDKKN